MSKKREKHFLLTVFADAQKTRFFAFSVNLVQSVSKNVTKHCFLIILRNFVQNAKKTMFLAFFAKFVRRVSKNMKKHRFLTLFADRRAGSSKNAVFRISCKLFSKCLKKRGKTLFSHTFCGSSCKKLQKSSFYAFLVNLVQSVS